jgi:hypothetical protein
MMLIKILGHIATAFVILFITCFVALVAVGIKAFHERIMK